MKHLLPEEVAQPEGEVEELNLHRCLEGVALPEDSYNFVVDTDKSTVGCKPYFMVSTSHNHADQSLRCKEDQHVGRP